MERSFKEEVAKLNLGDGEVFHGEGILAVTKALLQSGVAYVGGYQGAPVSLFRPRPSLRRAGEMVEQGVVLSEALSTPVVLQRRVRACHVQGSFKTKRNQARRFSKRTLLENPDFDYGRICLPPATYAQEKHKIDVRWPAAVRFIKERKLNETFAGDMQDLGILCQGGLYNAVIRALQQLGLADAFGASRVPIYCMNVTYPLIPEEITEFCRNKASVLVVEE